MLAAILAAALPLAAADAQRLRADERPIKEDPASNRRLDLAPKRNFNLFALGDVAIQGGRGSLDLGMAIINYGMCGADGNAILFPCPAVRQRDGVFRSGGFAFEFTAAVSRSDFRKIRAVYPGVAEAVGGGYTGHYALTGSGFTGLYDFGPADNSAGRLFNASTRSTVGDNSCRDKSPILEANYTDAPLSLLAGSDCPETWPTTGFDGARLISDEVYAQRFDANPTGRTFDFWRIPRETYASAPTLGSFSTYYETSDYFSENIRDWGVVTPLGQGRPRIRGFPMGLDLRVDAFVSTTPRLANAQFYQVQIINNSGRVYGTGVDYDSLYFGLLSATQGNYGNMYDVPELGALVNTGTGVNANCNNARIRGGIFGACNTAATRGFFRGGQGIVVLKSPIGDLRNKLYSRAGSRFFNPTHPDAGDTITYNHSHRCGFAVCSSPVNDFSERAQYGYISSREEDVLDGRQASDFAPNELWRVFHNRTAGNTSTAGEPRFNRWVPPGQWDYDDDGVLDTLKLDTCSDDGCVPRWTDTLPGGQVNRIQGSGTGQTIVAGPFSLAAGDTTGFVFGILAASDSVPFEAILRNTLDFYLGFYAAAGPPPAPRITAVEVPPARTQFQAGVLPFVRLGLGSEPASFVDPFFLKFASLVETETEFRAIRALNPGIADSIRARAAANVAEVLIFRSCDNGRTWDADGDCDGDPARGTNGQTVGTGWQAYAILDPVEEGGSAFPTTFTDANVVPGRSYLYSAVARSRGGQFIVRDTVNGREQLRILTVADTLTSTLASSGPTTRRVYVPVTAPAGLTAASFSVASDAGRGLATAPVTLRLTANAVPGTYRLEFGNRFTVIERQNSTTGAIQTQVIVADTVAQCRRGTTLETACVVNADTFTVADRLPVSGDGALVTTVEGDVTVRTTTYAGLGFVALRAGSPIFVTTTLTPDATTPADLLGSPLDPGFTIRVDNSVTGSGTNALEAVVLASGDTLNATILGRAVVQLREGAGITDRAATTTGTYEFRWRDDAFGPAVRQFTLNPANPGPLQQQLLASLEARADASTTVTDANFAAKLAAFDDSYDGVELVPATLPFTAVNATTGNALLFALPRQSRPGGGILFGVGNDTVRVQVPSDVWVPGDALVAFEIVDRDATDAQGNPVVENGEIVRVRDTVVAFAPLTLGCNDPRNSCNPLVTLGEQNPGATGYRPYNDGEKLVVAFNRPFTFSSGVNVVVAAPTPRQLTATDRRAVNVVPNPFVVQSQYDVLDQNRVGESRVLFTGLPPRGSLRIYSISGQFLQRLQWTEVDLQGTGDLPYNLRTREGTELATGIYIYVIEGTTGAGGSQTIRGKFVVIR